MIFWVPRFVLNVTWLQAKTEEWYGKMKPQKKIVTNLLATRKGAGRRIAGKLLLDSKENHIMAQIAGLITAIHSQP